MRVRLRVRFQNMYTNGSNTKGSNTKGSSTKGSNTKGSSTKGSNTNGLIPSELLSDRFSCYFVRMACLKNLLIAQ